MKKEEILLEIKSKNSLKEHHKEELFGLPINWVKRGFFSGFFLGAFSSAIWFLS